MTTAEPIANGHSVGRALLVLLVLPALVGAATGACVAGASLVVEGWALGQLATLPGATPAILAPLALLVTLAVKHYVTRAATPSTAELYIHVYNTPGGRIPLRQLPGRVLAAATTVGFGGSQGLESPSALMGAALGDVLGGWRRGRLTPFESRTLLIAGASAGIAAVFSSPAVGTFYGMEVPFRRDVDAPRFVPCAVAAAMAFVTRSWLIGPEYLVVLHGAPALDGVLVAGVLLVGLACGLGARLFATVDMWLHAMGSRRRPLERALVGGVALALLAWAGHALSGSWITFGPGYVAADWLFSGAHPLELMAVIVLIRTCGTLVCVYGGGGGGVFTSLACTGVFLGQLIAELIGRTETGVLPLVGAACFLGSGYRLPVGCAMFIAEACGELHIVALGLVAIGIGQVLMGEASVSDAKAESREPCRPAVW